MMLDIGYKISFTYNYHIIYLCIINNIIVQTHNLKVTLSNLIFEGYFDYLIFGFNT